MYIIICACVCVYVSVYLQIYTQTHTNYFQAKSTYLLHKFTSHNKNAFLCCIIQVKIKPHNFTKMYMLVHSLLHKPISINTPISYMWGHS